ncbi:hypothetical protein Scep_027009 [Stephania cephalantha]|uniref:Uncharacterized protein n=1 Tax=Stephania cephalantha TaxID=152367 RepID=A0AAP0ENT3_9MAGN
MKCTWNSEWLCHGYEIICSEKEHAYILQSINGVHIISNQGGGCLNKNQDRFTKKFMTRS